MKKQTKTYLTIGIIIIIIAGFLLTNPQKDETIEIGSILILSGQGSSWGNAARNGIDMAVEEINSDGGINGKTLVVNHQDNQADPQKTISAFNFLRNAKGIDIIIGTTWSHTGMAVAELADSQKVLMISPSLGKADFNENSDYIFNTWPHDFILSASLADYVYEKGHRKVALIGAEQIWVKEQTNAFKNRFEELGGSLEIIIEPIPDSADVNTEALKIKSTPGIDAIVSTTDGILIGAQIAKRMREVGIDLPIYSITIGKEDVAAAQGAYEGLEFLTFLTYTDEFKEKYDSKYGLENLDIGAPSAYDATMLIAQAIEETGSTNTTVLAKYLANIKEYSGASRDLISDGKGGFIKDYAIKKVINGEIEDIS